MERLEAKRVKGHTYYYYSKWARVDNRCRRVWQRDPGKLEDIVAAVQGRGPAAHRRRGLPRGIAPSPLDRKPPEHRLVDLHRPPPAPNAGDGLTTRSIPGDRRDQPGDQPT